MSWYKNLSRREFIQLAAAAAAASGMTACSRSPWRFLRLCEARALAAICDRLIPPDQDAGADWAQVVNFIDIQLCGPFRDARDLYRDGIGYTDATARTWYEKRFAELDDKQQVEILEAIERGSIPKTIWETVDSRLFFETSPFAHDAGLLRRSAAWGKSRAYKLEDGRPQFSAGAGKTEVLSGQCVIA